FWHRLDVLWSPTVISSIPSWTASPGDSDDVIGRSGLTCSDRNRKLHIAAGVLTSRLWSSEILRRLSLGQLSGLEMLLPVKSLKTCILRADSLTLQLAQRWIVFTKRESWLETRRLAEEGPDTSTAFTPRTGSKDES